MDLSKYDTRKAANEGRSFTLLTPDDYEVMLNADGSEQTIKLLGQDSDRYRKADQEAMDRRLSTGGRRKVTAKELESADIYKLAACSVEWNITTPKGEHLTGSPDQVKCREVYTEYPWIREQVKEFVETRSNFLSATTSS